MTKIEDTKKVNAAEEVMCGIVMPISAIGTTYTEKHWTNVLKIINEVISGLGYNGRLVSESSVSQFIQKDIVQNLYQDDIIICDVSGHNPNVLFELGMRLTFDKPTIIIKDYETSFPFDIQSIRCLQYPRGLNYVDIQEFKQQLSSSIQSTLNEAQKEGSSYSPFLQHFTITKVSDLKEVSTDSNTMILDEISFIKKELRNLIWLNQDSIKRVDLKSSRSLGKYRNEFFNKNSYFNEKEFNSFMKANEGMEFEENDVLNAFISYLFKKYSLENVSVSEDDKQLILSLYRQKD